ncbi:transport permease protein [Sphaerisporangium siamense]|uniref:Transport permease protein n=1 Tax=Sphaerisporangium siamense TaxID=795645 RepID=A0A7W7GEC2_9ACTN|nr:ABC transporter permease [Sphaerisporangium siamense]MBB4703901.1 ABC-2 type transport system permease protein [Sphaerisporangium siamense]GII82371.1 transport permease protein [Sphaerisporangium siamense]
MNPTGVAVRAGLERGRIEFRQSVTSAQDLWGAAFFPLIALVVMFLLRGNTVPGTGFSVGSHSVPGILAMNVVFNGLTAVAVVLTMDREDGTLLRAKAIPGGMLGYLVGKVTGRSGMVVVSVLVPLVPAALLFDGLDLASVSSWLTVAWVLALGLAAVLPLGAVIGSLTASTQSLSVVSLPIMVLLAVSGVFYPITALPGWVQVIAQVFPLYWMGLGLRSALLPDAMAAAEIGASWRHLETAGVLGAWAVAGLLLAPIVLRRMARRESGSSVAAKREKAMQRPM